MTSYPVTIVSPTPRDSISLDEDDLSDVEDEVFIRDGRNGFKFGDDRGAKRPLMAPRRKIGRSDLASRLKNKPRCRALCVPCCYALAALSMFVGFIALVIVLVTLFPLPIDKLKNWIASKTASPEIPIKLLPCINVQVTDIWSINLPKFTSETSMRALDIDRDGVDDIVFGYGTDESHSLPPESFCLIFFGIEPPCRGGVMALNGSTGQTIWRTWLPNAVFEVFCTADITGDEIQDCVVSGKGGVLCVLNGRDGTIVWQFLNDHPRAYLNTFLATFIPDQDSDGKADVLAAHTLQQADAMERGGRCGYLLIVSGRTGTQLARVPTPNETETFSLPQLLVRPDGGNMVLFGTGGQNSSGGLYAVQMNDITLQELKPITIYVDEFKGILSPVLLVDITGDDYVDIVSAFFNSTVVAFDGITFEKIWNYTVPNSETMSVPTPGYFNYDNVTDFLIKYQTGDGFPTYHYSQTLILNGKTGKPIYKPVIDSVGTQVGGLTVSMEGNGYDMFVFWTADCKNFEGSRDRFRFVPGSNIYEKSKADLCKLRFNSTMVTKLYGINEVSEPPGFLIYTSANRTSVEYNNTLTPQEEARVYMKQHPDFRVSKPSTDRILGGTFSVNIENSGSNFRHRDNKGGLIRDFGKEDDTRHTESDNEKSDYSDTSAWRSNAGDSNLQPDYDTYDADSDYTKKGYGSNSNRDPRSKPLNDTVEDEKLYTYGKSIKKNLADVQTGAYNMNDYKNVRDARYRLLHDLNTLPSDILAETYVREKEKQLGRVGKFEQRDLRYKDENESLRTVEELLRKKGTVNEKLPRSLWDVESEQEREDRENGYWRAKREAGSIRGIQRITSVGLLVKPLGFSDENSIDLVFHTYWLLPKQGARILLEKDLQCINEKMVQATAPDDEHHTLDKSAKEELFLKMCVPPSARQTETDNDASSDSHFYNELSRLSLGQMTVYRMRLKCECGSVRAGEKCVRILKLEDQPWSSHMGRFGDGYFKTRN